MRKKTTTASWDWKDQPMKSTENGALSRALRELGIHVYERPSDVGSDQFGYVLSTKELTAEEIQQADAEGMGITLEEYHRQGF